MEVVLLHNTPLWVADKAISKCWDKECYKDTINLDRIDRVANKHKHESTIEHLVYTFEIKGISRGLLQELARHRLASYSVKSTRYTLGELKQEVDFDYDSPFEDDFDRAAKYLVTPEEGDLYDSSVMYYNMKALNNVMSMLRAGMGNDKVKYMLPEAYKTELVMTINARALRNMLKLRSSKAALAEFRRLSNALFNNIPTDHLFLFSDYIDRGTESSSKED